MERRFPHRYVVSKILTDSDTYYANLAGAIDHYNRRLATLYDLPFVARYATGVPRPKGRLLFA